MLVLRSFHCTLLFILLLVVLPLVAQMLDNDDLVSDMTGNQLAQILKAHLEALCNRVKVITYLRDCLTCGFYLL